MQSGHRWTIWVHLTPDEEFKAMTPTGQILVRTIRVEERGVDGGVIPHVGIAGSAIKKDGTKALFDRQGYMIWEQLPMEVRTTIRQEAAKIHPTM